MLDPLLASAHDGRARADAGQPVKRAELIDIPDQNPLISIRGSVPIYGSPGLDVAAKMTEIRDLWEKHSRSEFPHEAYEAEIDFVSIDSFAAGVISSFLESSRALNSDSVIALPERATPPTS